MKKAFPIICAIVLTHSAALAADGRIPYRNSAGQPAMATVMAPVCSISASGVPETCADGLSASVSNSGLMSYKTASGAIMGVLPVVPVCSVDSAGVPQICDLSGGSSTDLSAYLTTATAAKTYVPVSSLGAASGVATLDAKGNVTAPIISNNAAQTGALQVNGQINVQGIAYFVSSMAQVQGIISGQAQKWTLTRRLQDTYTKLNSYNGSSWSAFAFYDDGSITTNMGTVANLGATTAAFTGTVSAPTLSASTAAYVPDTTTTDSTTAALNTESAAARFATTAQLSSYLKSTDAASTYLTIANAADYATLPQVQSQLSSYAKTSDLNSAVQTLMPIAGGTFTGTVAAPTPATSDNSTNVATTAYVNNALQVIAGSVQGDISASGSSLSLPIGASGLTLTMSYVSKGTGSLSIVSTSGSLTPVDIYETAAWGTTSFKGYVLDSGTVTTTATVVDSTFYLTSNAWGTYHIRVGGSLYVVDIFGSGAGARTTMSWRKIN